jgi:hypothetical protein
MEQLLQQLQQTLAFLLSLPSSWQALVQPTIQAIQAQLASLLDGGPPPGGGQPPGTLPTATPELESAVLFGAGVLALAGYGWRARRKQRRAAGTGLRTGGRRD